MTMKKTYLKITAALLSVLMLGFYACDPDDNGGTDPGPIENLITQNISENATWETGKVYVLGGRITVLDGVTLTIEPGVIVKGQAGTGANATALLVARGGTLMAEGTADAPITFTSVA